MREGFFVLGEFENGRSRELMGEGHREKRESEMVFFFFCCKKEMDEQIREWEDLK